MSNKLKRLYKYAKEHYNINDFGSEYNKVLDFILTDASFDILLNDIKSGKDNHALELAIKFKDVFIQDISDMEKLINSICIGFNKIDEFPNSINKTKYHNIMRELLIEFSDMMSLLYNNLYHKNLQIEEKIINLNHENQELKSQNSLLKSHIDYSPHGAEYKVIEEHFNSLKDK